MIRLADLHETLVEIRGDEARSWLNGQLTCNVHALPPGGSMRGLRLTKNGRILAVVRVLDRPHGLDLLVPRDRAEELVADLDRYIIMEDVELHPRFEERAYALLGEGHAQEGTIPGELFGQPVSFATSPDLDAACARHGATRLTDDELETLRIEAGEPGAAELSRGLLPQEAGLKALVSFTKGCYLGQEPVVMLEHRGRAPKRLARFRTAEPTHAGAPLTLPSGEAIGEITSAAGPFALALVPRRAEEEPSLFVDGKRALEWRFVDAG